MYQVFQLEIFYLFRKFFTKGELSFLFLGKLLFFCQKELIGLVLHFFFHLLGYLLSNALLPTIAC